VVIFKSQSDVKVQEVRILKETGEKAYISDGFAK
jgi:hypothetical protein